MDSRATITHLHSRSPGAERRATGVAASAEGRMLGACSALYNRAMLMLTAKVGAAQTLLAVCAHHLRALLRPTRMLARSEWERAYADGRWDYLGGLDELGHYSVVAGYCQALKPGGRLLELGCGEGLLLRLLRGDAYREYLGIDIAAEAIARAQVYANPRTTFAVGDIATFTPAHPFDAIVFNESLYYLSDATATLARLARSLAPGGVFIVSMYLHPRHALWRRLTREFTVCDTTQVRNRRGIAWTCRVLMSRP